MADKYTRVIYMCEWCGLKLNQRTDDHSMAPRAIYNDYDHRKYCSLYCARRGYAFYNELEQPELIEAELLA